MSKCYTTTAPKKHRSANDQIYQKCLLLRNKIIPRPLQKLYISINDVYRLQILTKKVSFRTATLSVKATFQQPQQNVCIFSLAVCVLKSCSLLKIFAVNK